MTRHIPDGNSLRPLKGIIIDLGNALQPEIYPSTPQERAADKMLRKARARPQPRDGWPWWAWFVFGAAAMLGAMGLAVIMADMIATGAATALHAKEYAGW